MAAIPLGWGIWGAVTGGGRFARPPATGFDAFGIPAALPPIELTTNHARIEAEAKLIVGKFEPFAGLEPLR
jgi:hypothetical protein